MDYCTVIKIVDEALQPVKREKSGHEVIYIVCTCI